MPVQSWGRTSARSLDVQGQGMEKGCGCARQGEEVRVRKTGANGDVGGCAKLGKKCKCECAELGEVRGDGCARLEKCEPECAKLEPVEMYVAVPSWGNGSVPVQS